MPIPDRYEALIPRILEDTEDDKITWKEGASQWTFVTTFGSYGLSVTDSGDVPKGEYTVTVYGSNGEEIDSFEVSAQEKWMEGIFLADNDFTPVENLWAAARRQARGVNEALKAIEGELDDIEAPGENLIIEDPPFE